MPLATTDVRESGGHHPRRRNPWGKARGWVVQALIVALVAAGFFALTPGGAGDQAAYAAETVADEGTRTVDFTKDWKFFLATRTPTVTDVGGDDAGPDA